MKLLQIDVSVNRGSTGRIAEEIGRQALSCGWKSCIAYGRYANPGLSETIKIGTLADQAFHLLQTRLFDRHGLHSIIATKQLIQKIKNYNPDIIQLHQLHGYYINLQVLFSFLKEFNKPVVWTFHDCWQITGHCCYFTTVECEKWRSLCFRCPLSHSYPASWFSDRSEANFNLKKELFSGVENLTIIPVSRWLDKIVSQSFLSDKKRVIILNGVDTDIFKPSDPEALKLKHNLAGMNVLLGVADMWSPHKGLDDFIKLAGLIGKNRRIILVGLNKNQIKNLPDNIIGVPRTENVNQLAQYYSLADVFINPSKSESFGLVTAEALACGTPAIVYDSTASPELIIPGTGYIADKGDIATVNIFAEKIIADGKSSYSSKCCESAENFYNKDKQFFKYIELYKTLLNN